MARRRVLILGATGFIGRNLTEHFSRDPDIELHAARFTRPEYPCPGVIWHQLDLRQPDQVERVVGGMDLIIQAAAVTSGSKDITARPHLHVTDNTVMNALLFRAAHDLGVGHVIFFSCAIMLASRPEPQVEIDLDLNAELEPRYFGAGWTKLYAEKMCEFYARQGRTRFTVIRHSNIYGPYDKFDLERSHVFGATVTKALTADRELVVWGTGEEARDLLHVDDLVDLVARMAVTPTAPFALYNAGAGVAIPVRDLVQRIVAASGRSLAIRHDLTKPSIPFTVALDCARAARDFGWRPQVDLAAGIAGTIAWWHRHHAADPAALNRSSRP